MAVEEHFYLIWPFAVLILQPKHIGKLIIISVLIIFVLKYYMLNIGLSINYFTFTRIDQIMIGAFLAILEMRNFFNRKGALKRFLLMLVILFPLGAIVNFISSDLYYLKEMLKYPILGLFFFGLIGVLISMSENHIINRILKSKILQYLGRISYGIYVWHILALGILNRIYISRILFLDFFLSVILTILLAHFSYYYFEKHFLQFKYKSGDLK